MKLLLQECEDAYECAPLHVFDEKDHPEMFEDAEDAEYGGRALVEVADTFYQEYLDAADKFWTLHAQLLEMFDSRQHERKHAEADA